ncbi:MAG: ABC transporter permease, partial [Planctomycetaceae bacterium]
GARLLKYRFFVICLMLPVGVFAAFLIGPQVEKWLFAGNMFQWLSGQVGTGTGAWMILLLPASGVLAGVLVSRYVTPWLVRRSGKMSRSAIAGLDFAKFLAGSVCTLILALSASWLLTQMGFDPRGTYVDTYDQRNALIVGFVMGFAVIPLIYTLADDALSSVPEQLRAASLGAGATPWQTTIRIVIPTAMSGLFSAVMVGLGRAVGETMIVLMAGGNIPVMDPNMFSGFRTLAANIAVELAEAVRNSTHYRTLFLAALTLFVLTFIVNTVAEMVRIRFRRRVYQM